MCTAGSKTAVEAVHKYLPTLSCVCGRVLLYFSPTEPVYCV